MALWGGGIVMDIRASMFGILKLLFDTYILDLITNNAKKKCSLYLPKSSAFNEGLEKATLYSKGQICCRY
jgi:hypothetical protein